MIKRKMSLLLAAAVVATGIGVAVPAAAKTTAGSLPSIVRAVPSITMAEVGDYFTYAVTSKDYEGDVQYRIWYQDLKTKEWGELTDGYSEAVPAGQPFMPEAAKNLPEGQYKAVIWVKRAGEEGKVGNKNGTWDTLFQRSFKIQKDGYFDGRAKLDDLGLKDTYEVGEYVTIKGSDNYKIHYLDSYGKWTNDDTYEKAKGASDDVKFDKPGVYMVDVWGMTENPTAAVKKQGYGGLKLQVINVVPAEEEVTATVEIQDAFDVFNKTVVLKLKGTNTPENFKVVSKVTGKELKYYAGSKTFKEVVPSTLVEEAGKAENYEIINTKVEVPAVKDVEVTAAFDAFNKTVAVTLDSETPEMFKVTSKVTGKELKYYEGSKTFKEVVPSTLAEDAGNKENYTVEVK